MTCPPWVSASSNSVDLAIKQANEAKAIPGWTLELAAEDDEAKPDVGKNAATKLAGDDEVVGVVGALNSSVSQSLQPVLAAANIAQISPANTGPSLTMGPDRPRIRSGRTRTTSGPAPPTPSRVPSPRTTCHESGYKKVATIHDKKTYGQGLVDAFTAEYKQLGGKIVAAETINPDDKDFCSVITKVKGANPEAVYYGGEYPQAGPLEPADEGRRSERSADGWRRHLRPRLHRARRQDLRRRPGHLGRRADRELRVGQGLRR